MDCGVVLRAPYTVALGVLRWACDYWLWAEGRALLSGVDLTALPPPRLISVLTTLWMDWAARDEDTANTHNRFIGAFAKAATPVAADAPESEADNPFATVMHGGPAGVISR